MIDAHIHLQEKDLPFFVEREITCIINGDAPHEWERNHRLVLEYPHFFASYGIHPWKADMTQLDTLASYQPYAAFIGEVGLDSVWCKVDLEVQKACFKAQLALAQDWRVPVILHTKGEERTVLEMIQQYGLIYLVHWLDTVDVIGEFNALGCYFTVPINLPDNPIAQALVQQVPVEKLFLESDGMMALRWVYGASQTYEDYWQRMRNNERWVAQAKGMTVEALRLQFQHNFQRLCQIPIDDCATTQ